MPDGTVRRKDAVAPPRFSTRSAKTSVGVPSGSVAEMPPGTIVAVLKVPDATILAASAVRSLVTLVCGKL